MIETIRAILPSVIRNLLDRIPSDKAEHIQEIRIKAERPLTVVFANEFFFVTRTGHLSKDATESYSPSRADCLKLLQILTNHSIYSFEEELRKGYITVPGGHRIGLSGRTIVSGGCVRHIKEVGSYNIRIARQVLGAGEPIFPQLLDYSVKSIFHTLVISPPQQGKTTLIRDLARLISCGSWPIPGFANGGLRVGIVDERSELAACVAGVPTFDVGPLTDVMDSCPKAEGMMMMIRSMSPEVLIVDEIGSREDAAAIEEALHAGIRVIATAHGRTWEEVKERPVLKELVQAGRFERYVVLSNRFGIGSVDSIYDGAGNLLRTAKWHTGR